MTILRYQLGTKSSIYKTVVRTLVRSGYFRLFSAHSIGPERSLNPLFVTLLQRRINTVVGGGGGRTRGPLASSPISRSFLSGARDLAATRSSLTQAPL